MKKVHTHKFDALWSVLSPLSYHPSLPSHNRNWEALFLSPTTKSYAKTETRGKAEHRTLCTTSFKLIKLELNVYSQSGRACRVVSGGGGGGIGDEKDGRGAKLGEHLKSCSTKIILCVVRRCQGHKVSKWKCVIVWPFFPLADSLDYIDSSLEVGMGRESISDLHAGGVGRESADSMTATPANVWPEGRIRADDWLKETLDWKSSLKASSSDGVEGKSSRTTFIHDQSCSAAKFSLFPFHNPKSRKD